VNIEPFQFGNDEPIHFIPIRDRIPLIRRTAVAAEAFHAYANTFDDPHVLDVLLLTFVVDGAGRHRIGDREHVVSGPCVDVTLPGESHCLRTAGGPLDEINVYLDVERRAPRRPGGALSDAIGRLLVDDPGDPERIRHVPLDRSTLADVRPVLDALVRETHTPRVGSEDVLHGLSRVLLVECARAADPATMASLEHAYRPELDVIEVVRLHLDATFAEPHSLASLAQMAHLERTYFSKLFSKRVGLPVSEYLLRLRIRYVIGELQRSDSAIGTIAAAAGFHDASYFGRTFRRIAGTTPSAYRRGFRAGTVDLPAVEQ
jgi:AraC-like DNA-binding protein